MVNQLLQNSITTTLIQAVGIMLVAGFLLPMTRVIPGRFLRYWAQGWVFLTLGLFSLFASFQFPQYHRLFLVGYCFGEYLFGFLLWVGCREYALGQPPRLIHLLTLVPLTLLGAILPSLLGDYRSLFPIHSAVMGTIFVAALLTTFRAPVHDHTPTASLWLLRGCVGGLTLLLWHYAVVAGYAVYLRPGTEFAYLSYSSLYDVALETGLAFAMVTLSVDRMREELEAKNRQLAEASTELAQAARTDALTGLLNRRAFDELLRDPAAPQSGSLAVLDVNDLKPINDRYGHTAGDATLQLVARALRNHFRVTDPLFRTGGDEFVVVMPSCPEGDLASRMMRVGEALTGLRLPGVGEPTDVLVAWGVAGFTSRDALMTAFHQADEAMYTRKRSLKSANSQPLNS